MLKTKKCLITFINKLYSNLDQNLKLSLYICASLSNNTLYYFEKIEAFIIT